MEGLEQTAKLLKLVRERGFQPGDRLPSERDLAALFGMSRGAVREALIRLDTLRIVESRPKSGVFLQPFAAERSVEAMVLFAQTDTPLSREDVIQSVEMRNVLESEAIRLACARRTQDDLDRLKQIIDECAATIERGETLADLDAEFHKAIVAATKNDVLLRFVNVFYLMSRKRREIYFRNPGQAHRSHAEHQQIYSAIVARDGERALKLTRSHMKGVEIYFKAFFAEDAAQAKATSGRATAAGHAATPARRSSAKAAPASKPARS